MRRSTAALGSAAWFFAAPTVLAGLVPWWLTRWRRGDTFLDWLPLRFVGFAMIVAGTAVIVAAFARFVIEGAGTPVPVAPTERLVVGGYYRYVRNPMYVAVVAAIVGNALVLAQPALLVYAAALLAVFAAFVRLYEEPTLRRRYGAEYETYRRAVPGWWPRLRPWRPTDAPEGSRESL